MSTVRNWLAMAALATATLVGPVAGQAATMESTQTASVGEDYTFNTVINTPTSVPIGPVSYAFEFTSAATNAILTSTFTYVQLSGVFTGGFLSWTDGVNTVTQALVANVATKLAVPLAAAGPKQTLTVGFDEQSGTGVLAGGVSVTEIPLPASGMLLLGGLGLAAVARRRKPRAA